MAESASRKKADNTGKKRGRVIKLAENAPSAGGQMAVTMPDDIVFPQAIYQCIVFSWIPSSLAKSGTL